MAAFEFRLEPLLELRRRVEDQKRLAYVTKRRELNEIDRELQSFTGALTPHARPLHEVVLYERAVGARIARRESVRMQLTAAEAELTIAGRDRRVIEKLRERRLTAFERERARRDELEIQEANAR